MENANNMAKCKCNLKKNARIHSNSNNNNNNKCRKIRIIYQFKELLKTAHELYSVTQFTFFRMQSNRKIVISIPSNRHNSIDVLIVICKDPLNHSKLNGNEKMQPPNKNDFIAKETIWKNDPFKILPHRFHFCAV